MIDEPDSKLTRERPDIWHRALTLATEQTGMLYLPKRPLADGTISACGGYYGPLSIPGYGPPGPKPSPPHEDVRRREIKEIEDGIREHEQEIERLERVIADKLSEAEKCRERVKEIRARIEKARGELKRRKGLSALVPDGAMEWLLHEVGHYVAATPEERLLPDYGYGQEAKGVGKAREWQAWAFEEIVLAPWGPSRLFCPPTHRGGAAFSKNGPMPQWALHHAERQMAASRVDVERWRALYGEWIRWNPGGWNSVN